MACAFALAAAFARRVAHPFSYRVKVRTGLNSRDRSFGALFVILRRVVGAGTELLAAVEGTLS